MLDELQVRDVALIREATVSPAPGLTVITGETGAGKTALLSALKLLVGERADAGFVREGASSLSVEGRFFSGAQDEEGLLASRSVTADGRSRVRLDGAMASVGELAARIGASVDLCGQHEHQQLLKPMNHMRLLDAWAGDAVEGPLAAYRIAYAEARAAAEELDRILDDARADEGRIDEARFIVGRIDAVCPREGEYEDLLAELPRCENAEALIDALRTARESLAGDGGALDAIAVAAECLEGTASLDSASSVLAQTLRESSFVIEDVAREVRSRGDALSVDPVALERMQERLASFQGLMRSFGPTMADVLDARSRAGQVLDAVEGSEEVIADACRRRDEVEARLTDAARSLDAARAIAAPRFAQAVSGCLERLEMGGSDFLCEVRSLDRAAWTESGPDSVEFLFRPGQGMSPRPLARIASGGEASRLMLAIKVALGTADDVETLVFDEVDAGVGGAAARAVADVLVDLARTHQVMVVTHLPQIAAVGEVHYLVEKREGEMPETIISLVDGEARVDEIARMLSGDTGPVSRAHAIELLGVRSPAC